MGASLVIFFLFGIYYLLIGMMVYFETVTRGNWRPIMVMYAIPVAISEILSFFILDESARF
jgi:hypothetical protein